ncbi:hypothetical protein HBN54_003511 [Hymenobacter sp. 1B]|uniref:Uncharacterized protein n=1 Tax=Hymenobacter artigasi TaxID=2719616 RepID=A0ABX1HLZ4_9BACT|nr:hypothetical protein [Hymenobacter artigasi]
MPVPPVPAAAVRPRRPSQAATSAPPSKAIIPHLLFFPPLFIPLTL